MQIPACVENVKISAGTLVLFLGFNFEPILFRLLETTRFSKIAYKVLPLFGPHNSQVFLRGGGGVTIIHLLDRAKSAGPNPTSLSV